MSVTFSYEEALEASLNYFNDSSISASVFLDKYALRNDNGELLEKTPDDMHHRAAREIARIEKKKFKNPLSEEKIYGYLKDFRKIIPQGSVLYGIGNPYQYVTLSNCYVLNPPMDSYAGIHFTDEQITQISKRRGGCGSDISLLRPIGMATKNSSRTTSGIIPFMERLSNTIREVGQNGRRGAKMITIDVHHPQVLDFTRVKLDDTKVTGANLSIKLSDEFLNAVLNNTAYEQRWPVDANIPQYSQMVAAKEVWKEIIRCAWLRAEPGLLFWDKIISESPADCYADFGFKTISTNPCSELPLSILDSCRLLLLNLMAYVKHPYDKYSYFDYEEFYKDAQVAQRLLDDIIDLELECIDRIIKKVKSDPEPMDVKIRELNLWKAVKQTCEDGRRTGLGITALGDCLAALGVKYGTDCSIGITEKIYQTLKFASYRSSVDMAKELGPFPVWNWELEKDNPFINRIKDELISLEQNIHIFDSKLPDLIYGKKLYEDIQKYGRRNIANLTTAPAGSMSIEALLVDTETLTKNNKFDTYEENIRVFNTSSGIEPIFLPSYVRRKKINPNDENARTDFIDKSGDHWQEFTVYHSGVEAWMKITGETDITKSPYHGACANDIDWKQRVKLQAAAQKHVDHAISSTINLPNDVTEEKVAEIYETAWKFGCKGITVYRDGCRTGVLVETANKPKIEARPKEVECDVYHITVKGKEYLVLVGILNDKPYEVFACKNGILKKKIKKGKIVRVRKSYYKAVFEDDTEISPLASACDEHEEAYARLMSIALRHGVEVEAIVNQLEKVNGDMYGFTRSLSRALKKYIPDGIEVKGEICEECESNSIVRESGCKTCKNCGWSKCL